MEELAIGLLCDRHRGDGSLGSRVGHHGAGWMRSIWMPSRSHQTASLLSRYVACAEAKGTPLSVRITCGSQNYLNVRSKTVNANFSSVVANTSQSAAIARALTMSSTTSGARSLVIKSLPAVASGDVS